MRSPPGVSLGVMLQAFSSDSTRPGSFPPALSMLRALSKSQNWPAGPWSEQSFWQSILRLFPRVFAEKPSPSNLVPRVLSYPSLRTRLISFSIWLMWLDSFDWKWNSHDDGNGLASQFFMPVCRPGRDARERDVLCPVSVLGNLVSWLFTLY